MRADKYVLDVSKSIQLFPQILEKYYLSFTECLRTKFDIHVSKVYPEFDIDRFLKDFDNCHFTGFLQVRLFVFL